MLLLLLFALFGLVSLHFIHFCMQPVAGEVIKLRSNSRHTHNTCLHNVTLHVAQKYQLHKKKIFYAITQQCQHKTNKILNALDCMRSIFQCTPYFVFNDSYNTRNARHNIGISAKVQTNNGKATKEKKVGKSLYLSNRKI